MVKMIVNDKKELEKINKIYETLHLGTVKKATILKETPNKVYQIQTDKKEYYLLKYNSKTIKSEKELNVRKRQLSVSEKLSTNGVPMILPLKFEGKYFIRYKKEYYLIYDYKAYEPKKAAELKEKALKKVANTTAIIHKLNIKSEIPCGYHALEINFNKYLKKLPKIDEELYQTLYQNYFLLEEIIKQYNENSKYAKNNICASHKSQNILWIKDYMYIGDYDSFYLENPSVSLAENAFYYSYIDNNIKETNYKEYLKSYIRKYGPLVFDYKVALSIAPLKQLEKLEQLLQKCVNKEKEAIPKATEIINELVIYANKKDTFYDIYLSIVKNNRKKSKVNSL